MRDIGKAGYLLTAFAIFGSGLLAFVNWSSHDRIVAAERASLLRRLTEVFPAALLDNDIASDVVKVTDRALLGSKLEQSIYLARHATKPAGAVLSVVAPNGYSGPIKLLVGIKIDGTLTGVRILEHKETPGLGDAIEPEKSDWIKQFSGLSLENPTTEQWKVKRDGGQFDQFTGATITPRAVVKAIYNAQVYFAQHKNELFAQSVPPKGTAP